MEPIIKNEHVVSFLNYLKHVRRYSEYTISSYTNDILNFERYILSESLAVSLERLLNVRVCKSYVMYLSEHDYSKRSIARIISALRTFYNYLFDEKIIDRNYFLEVPIPKQNRVLPDVLSHQEILEILHGIPRNNTLGYRNYLIVNLLYSTGIRVQELVDIKLIDIDLMERTIKITGKGKKQRIVFFHQQLANILNNYILYYRSSLLTKSDSDTNILLLNKNGTPLTTRGVRKILKTIVDEMGLTYHLHPHVLRHAFATEMLNNGADIRGVQELLGHEHLSTTQIYTHISQEKIFETFHKLNPRSKQNLNKESETHED